MSQICKQINGVRVIDMGAIRTLRCKAFGVRVDFSEVYVILTVV